MKRTKLVLACLALIALAFAGCIVSGTFVIVEDFNFTADTGWYWKPIDLSTNADWQKHKDKLDQVEQVGFEMTIQNTSNQTTEFNVWFSAAFNSIDDAVEPDEIPVGSPKVISGLVVPANSTRKISYAESLGIIQHPKLLARIVKHGRFDYFGTSTGGSGDFPFNVTDGKIIVTLSASET